jgi:bifunctional enzyme CysN/CysC/sulfate adenylyltransferase subunit 1
MDAEPVEPGKTYLLQHGPHQLTARVTEVLDRLEVDNGRRTAARELGLNDIGLVRLECTRPLVFDTYRENRRTGAFVLVDSLTNRTVAAGMIERRLEQPRRKTAGSFAAEAVAPAERTEHYGHTAGVVALGRRADLLAILERRLFEMGAHVVALREPVEPMNPLLEAGLLVLTVEPVEGALEADLLELPAGEEAASGRILDWLRTVGVLRASDEFRAGEGI